MRLHRTQILLEPEQHQALLRIARAEKRNMSDVVRDAVQKELARRDEASADRAVKRLAWMKATEELAERIAAQRGGKPIEPVPEDLRNELWDEHHAELDAHIEKLANERRRAAIGGG
jgi:hypothetical protein